MRIINEEYNMQDQQDDLNHVFMDFKKAFDRFVELWFYVPTTANVIWRWGLG